MAAKRGIFIVLDGTEGCGKSTQLSMLRERLGRDGISDALFVRDPGTTRIGEQIRSILLNPDHAEMSGRSEMLLYMAARAQMMREIILPALEAGNLVVSDRFVSSTLAYQLGAGGLTADEIRQVADVAISSRWPDLTILLDLTVEKSLQRLKPKFQSGQSGAAATLDRIEQRPVEYHEQVRRNYLAQAVADPNRYHVIDASRTPNEIHTDVHAAIASLLR